MKHLIVLLVITFSATTISAQKTQTIYAEALGNGFLGSINYDFAPLKTYKNFRIKAGIGGVAFPIIISHLKYLIGKEKHFIEVGGGISTVVIENSTNEYGAFIAPSGSLQYRFEHTSGFILRAGLAPTFMSVEEAGSVIYQKGFRLHPGVSVGYAF